MKIAVTKEDLKEALCRSFLLTEKRWLEMEAKAREIAAERLLQVNRERIDELLLVPPGSPKWWGAMKEIDRLWAKGDKLMEIAYPRSPK